MFHQDDTRDEEGEWRDGKSHLEPLDESLELEMDDLNSELDAHSPLSGDETLSRRSTLRQARRRAEPTSRQASISGSLDLGSDVGTGLGLDLATELGRAGESTGMTSRQVSRSGLPAGHEGELQKENKRLREELKAVQLYCSKVCHDILCQASDPGSRYSEWIAS